MPRYRGRLAICASKSKKAYMGIASEPPYGCVVAVCNLVDCKEMELEDVTQACCLFRPGAYSWFLEDIVRVRPVPVRGALGLFNIDPAIIEILE